MLDSRLTFPKLSFLFFSLLSFLDLPLLLLDSRLTFPKLSFLFFLFPLCFCSFPFFFLILPLSSFFHFLLLLENSCLTLLDLSLFLLFLPSFFDILLLLENSCLPILEFGLFFFLPGLLDFLLHLKDSGFLLSESLLRLLCLLELLFLLHPSCVLLFLCLEFCPSLLSSSLLLCLFSLHGLLPCLCPPPDVLFLLVLQRLLLCCDAGSVLLLLLLKRKPLGSRTGAVVFLLLCEGLLALLSSLSELRLLSVVERRALSELFAASPVLFLLPGESLSAVFAALAVLLFLCVEGPAFLSAASPVLLLLCVKSLSTGDPAEAFLLVLRVQRAFALLRLLSVLLLLSRKRSLAFLREAGPLGLSLSLYLGHAAFVGLLFLCLEGLPAFCGSGLFLSLYAASLLLAGAHPLRLSGLVLLTLLLLPCGPALCVLRGQPALVLLELLLLAFPRFLALALPLLVFELPALCIRRAFLLAFCAEGLLRLAEAVALAEHGLFGLLCAASQLVELGLPALLGLLALLRALCCGGLLCLLSLPALLCGLAACLELVLVDNAVDGLELRDGSEESLAVPLSGDAHSVEVALCGEHEGLGVEEALLLQRAEVAAQAARSKPLCRLTDVWVGLEHGVLAAAVLLAGVRSGLGEAGCGEGLGKGVVSVVAEGTELEAELRVFVTELCDAARHVVAGLVDLCVEGPRLVAHALRDERLDCQQQLRLHPLAGRGV